MAQAANMNQQEILKNYAAASKRVSKEVRSVWLELAANVTPAPLTTAVVWPIDVVKNHALAGRPLTTAVKHKFSFKGVGFALAAATVTAADISLRFVCSDHDWAEKMPTTSKVLVTAAPLLAIVPITSVLERLKLNSQIGQVGMKEAFRKVILKDGYRGLFRGFLPHASIHAIFYASIILPGVLFTEKAAHSWAAPTIYVNPLLLVLALVVTTPLDIVKTRAMLGESVCPRSIMTPNSLLPGLGLRSAYFLISGALLGSCIDNLETVLYHLKMRYVAEKVVRASSTVKDDAFDNIIPLETSELDDDSIVMSALTRDG